MEKLYYSAFSLEGYEIIVAATEDGLVYIGSFIHDLEDFMRWAQKHYANAKVVRDDENLKLYVTQLQEYSEKKREVFDFALDVRHGTPFQRIVWEALSTIPYGQTVSYSDIAHQIHRPSAVRAVANAIGKNSIPIVIPCHRVIGKNGALTGFAGGLEMKKILLSIEH